MDEMKMYQEGQATDGGGLSEVATMPEMLEQMRQIFAERDMEYTRMEAAYQKRKESLDEKEASLKETLSGLEGRIFAVTKREEAVQEKETKLQEQIQNLAKEKVALQEAQETLEKEKTEQWMQVSLLREEARNEKLRSQRLAGEYEEKLSRLPADTPYLSALQDVAGQEARKQMEEKIAILETSLRQKEQDITKLRAEYQNLPEKQKKDMEALHALAKELTEEKEVLEEENKHLKEENRRLQEEKGELFKKLMAGAQSEMLDRESWQENGGREEEAARAAFRSTEEIKADDTSVSQKEPESADVLLGEEPLTAEILQDYLQENGMDARLLHSSEGELVAATAGGLQVMFSFGKPPRFDIRKKQKGGWGIRKLIKRYNENNAGLMFSYDETEEELIGSAGFSPAVSPEDLVHKVYQAARIYFGYRDGEEA